VTGRTPQPPLDEVDEPELGELLDEVDAPEVGDPLDEVDPPDLLDDVDDPKLVALLEAIVEPALVDVAVERELLAIALVPEELVLVEELPDVAPLLLAEPSPLLEAVELTKVAANVDEPFAVDELAPPAPPLEIGVVVLVLAARPLAPDPKWDDGPTEVALPVPVPTFPPAPAARVPGLESHERPKRTAPTPNPPASAPTALTDGLCATVDGFRFIVVSMAPYSLVARVASAAHPGPVRLPRGCQTLSQPVGSNRQAVPCCQKTSICPSQSAAFACPAHKAHVRAGS
jgi:hypothetical protein